MLSYQKLVEEDLNVGTERVWITAPGGGELRATQVGIHTFARGQQRYTATWAPGAIAAGGSATTTVTVPDASTGDFVMASHSAILTNDLRISGNIQADGVAQVIIHNPTASSVTVASGTVAVVVFPAIGVSTDPVVEAPTADFTWTETEAGVSGDSYDYDFDSTVTGGTAPYVYAWDFGDGSGTDSGEDPLYVWSRNGWTNPQDFTVTLTVTDANLQQDVVQKVVTVTFNE